MLCMPPKLQLNVSLMKDDRGEVHYIVGVFFLNKLKTQSGCLRFVYLFVWFLVFGFGGGFFLS